MEFISGRDIVIVGLQPWDTEIGSNCKNIAVEFSKHNRVLYVNSPLDRITTLRNKEDKNVRKRLEILKGNQSNLEEIQENLWVYYPDVIIESINWIKIDLLFDILNKRNNRKISAAIERAMRKLEFKDVILFNDNDIFRSFYLKDYLKPSVSVYYSRDYLLGVDYWKHHGKRLEPELMAKSDICVANSNYLVGLCRKFNPNSYYVGQGCEVELFLHANDLPIPHDVEAIQGPRIGYVGALQSLRLDLEVIRFMAKERPGYQIVLVGPEDDEFKSSDLHQLTNVHFLGSKKPDELPGYINAFDVCINPQLVNEVTIGNYPRKIDEYLAVGKPTVATKTESMQVFADYVYLAENKHQYLELIDKAINSNNESLVSERKAFASGHTWEASVELIYSAIDDSLK
ncbi:glycosyltransferase [Pedobacter frigoris]|uniref:Glycosyltransferase family 1 protein n=1 Tax=Pedobacter frigoris TaxID=2571272 RepID=A0A4U1CP61_9SPHI|nr:glycosyltransferase [Pedobacter frigoris]TKC09324.1 glycosyltransferase family 1 protein [Pedobacter frigoris]